MFITDCHLRVQLFRTVSIIWIGYEITWPKFKTWIYLYTKESLIYKHVKVLNSQRKNRYKDHSQKDLKYKRIYDFHETQGSKR